MRLVTGEERRRRRRGGAKGVSLVEKAFEKSELCEAPMIKEYSQWCTRIETNSTTTEKKKKKERRFTSEKENEKMQDVRCKEMNLLMICYTITKS